MDDPNQPSVVALAAGALAAQGKTQNEIAGTLGISQSAVSRLLKDAASYVEIQRTFRWDRLPATVQEEVRRKISKREISDLIARIAQGNGQPAPAVSVVTLPTTDDTAEKFGAFAPQAAEMLRNFLVDVRGRVGVAWGSTLWHTVEALRRRLPSEPFRAQIPVEFVPLCGDPLIDSQERYADRTSSRIVSDLNKAVNGDGCRPAWLGVPAYIPRRFTAKNKKIGVIEELIDLAPQYPRIFGPRSKSAKTTAVPIAGDLHMIITAAGPAVKPLGFGHTPLLGLTEEESKTLAESIYGDVGGVLLPRVLASSGKKTHISAFHPLVTEITKRWTGLKIDHLRACAARAFTEQSDARPGVCLFTFGASHADIVLEAVRQGLVNQLIIGSDLEQALISADQVVFPKPPRS